MNNYVDQVKGVTNYVNGSGNLTNIKQIAAGGYYSLFLTNDGKVFSCGKNNEEQLGFGNTLTKNKIQEVK